MNHLFICSSIFFFALVAQSGELVYSDVKKSGETAKTNASTVNVPENVFLDKIKQTALAATIDGQIQVSLRRLDFERFEPQTPPCFKEGHYSDFNQELNGFGSPLKFLKANDSNYRIRAIKERLKYHEQLLKAAVEAQYWDTLFKGVDSQVEYYSSGGVDRQNVARLTSFRSCIKARRNAVMTAFPALDVYSNRLSFKTLRDLLVSEAKSSMYALWREPPKVGKAVTALFPEYGLVQKIMNDDGGTDALTSSDPAQRQKACDDLSQASVLKAMWAKPISPVNDPKVEQASLVADREIFAQQTKQLQEICSSSGEDLVGYDVLVNAVINSNLPENPGVASAYLQHVERIERKQKKQKENREKIFAVSAGSSMIAAFFTGGATYVGAETLAVVSSYAALLAGGALTAASLYQTQAQVRTAYNERAVFLSGIGSFDKSDEATKKAMSMVVYSVLTDGPVVYNAAKAVREVFMSSTLLKGNKALQEDLIFYIEKQGVNEAGTELQQLRSCFFPPLASEAISPKGLILSFFLESAYADARSVKCESFFAKIRRLARGFLSTKVPGPIAEMAPTSLPPVTIPESRAIVLLRTAKFRASEKYPKGIVNVFKSGGVLPKHSVKSGNATYYLSDPFYIDNGRTAVFAVVEAKGVRTLQVFYKSRSQGGFRLLPAKRSDGWLDKGFGHEHQLDLPNDIDEAIAKLPIREVPHGEELIDGVVPRYLGEVDYVRDARDVEASRRFKMDPQLSKIKNIPLIQSHEKPLLTKRGYSYAKPEDVHLISGFEPDFSKPVKSFSTETALDGKSTVFVYRSKNGDAEYSLLYDGNGHAQVVKVSNTSPVRNRLGLSSMQYDGEEITVPRWEYPKQIPLEKGLDLEQLTNNSGYLDNWNYVKRIPLIRDFFNSTKLPMAQ